MQIDKLIAHTFLKYPIVNISSEKLINFVANIALNEMVCGKVKLIQKFKCLQMAQVFEATT